jgi:outer membrane lipoprotein SlyB
MANRSAKRSAQTAATAMAITTRGTLAASRPAAAMSLTTSLTTAAVRLPVAAATLLVALGLQGCVGTNMSTNTSTNSSPPQAQAYSGSAPAQPEQVVVRLGVVQSVRSTQIAANGTQPSGFGSSGTGSGNGLASGAVGAGQSSLVTGEVGSIAGAVASNAIENGIAIRDGLEITVRLDSGELRAIDQQATGETFQAGDRVRVLSGDGVTRVTH